MTMKKYEGLKAELVVFGDKDINTIQIPLGYSGCEVGSIAYYVTWEEGMTAQYGSCWYYDDDDIQYNWGTYGKRIGD